MFAPTGQVFFLIQLRADRAETPGVLDWPFIDGFGNGRMCFGQPVKATLKVMARCSGYSY